MMPERLPHRLPSDAGFEEISNSLKVNGVAIVPGFLDQKSVSDLLVEVDDLVQREHQHQLKDGQSSLGRFTMQELVEIGKTKVLSIPGNQILSRLSQDFFVPYAPDFHKVYCHHDVEKMSFNNSWHFDRGLTLKFFFYLNDVDRTNGAFCYDLGSHRSNAVKQHLWWEASMPILNYVPPEEIALPVDLEGPAGSLIIFDASGYHKAGDIVGGGERWVVRYHVRAGARQDGKAPAPNPYARRNWTYRSACYSVVAKDMDAPWSRLPSKGASASQAGTSLSTAGGAATPVNVFRKLSMAIRSRIAMR